jgi:hypothetical protein
MKAALAKLLTGLAKKKLKQKIGQASSLFSNGEYGTAIIALLAPIIPITFIIFIIICAIMLPILLVQQFIQDSQATDDMVLFEKINDMIVLDDWCKDNDPNCEKEATQKYYEELQKVYNDYKKDGVEIDVQLITATIFYANTHRNDIFTEDDEGEITDGDIKLKDISRLAKNMVNGNNLDYEKYNNYLIETYIPKRFSKLYEDRTDKENAIKEIADEIMGFKSKEGGSGSGEFASCNVINTSCPGITISGGQYAGTYTLEEYIAGVISHEVGSGWPDEALKAQAIAARSYALSYTNNCTKTIANSTGAQTFEPAHDERLIKATEETAGMVMTYNDQVIHAEYGAWWGNNGGTSCGGYKNCQNGQCSIDLYKLPNHEQWTFTMPQNYFAYGAVSDTNQMSDYSIQALGGHCRGMTQFGAKYLDLGEHKSYSEILRTFYSDGVVLSTFGNNQNSCSQSSSTQGLIASNYKGFMQRVSNPTAADYYYSQNYFYSSNVGQCVWYAQRRALEILNTVDIEQSKKQQAIQAVMNTTGNGRDWWNNPSLKMFGTSTNYAEPKVGALIVWRYTSQNIANMGADYGHIGVVEAVDYENRTMTVSDGWKNNWNSPNTIDYASFGFRTVPFEWAKNYGNPDKYIFLGYVYLLD